MGPAAVRALAEKTRAAGVALVDAPVSGSVSLAEAGEITAMVGAEPRSPSTSSWDSTSWPTRAAPGLRSACRAVANW